MELNFETLLLLTAVAILLTLMHTVNGYSITSIVDKVKVFFGKMLHIGSGKLESVNQKALQIQTTEEKRKSFRYKFYVFASRVIGDLGWDPAAITPELLFIWTTIATLFLILLFSSIISNTLIKVMLFVTIQAWIYAIMYLLGRRRSIKRNRAIMDAEDLICQNITEIPAFTLRDVTPKVDKIIRQPFEKFVASYFASNQSFDEALLELNMAIGPRFNDLYTILLSLHNEGRPGMIDAFKDNIERNALARELNIEKEAEQAKQIKEFLICMGLLVATFFYTYFAFAAIAKFYSSLMGQVVILLYLSITVIVLCRVQYLQSQDYRG